MTKFLVTGGSGFLGYHVVDRILKDPDNLVEIFDMVEPVWWHEISDKYRVNFTYGNILDCRDVWWDRLLNDMDSVIHLAGILGTTEQVRDPTPSIEVNTLATVSMLTWILNHKIDLPVVLTVNGNGKWNNTYAISKEAAGRFALMFNKEFGTQFRVVRPYNAFGEWQKSKPIRKVFPHFAIQALIGEDIDIFGSGNQTFDLVYAGHVAEVLYQAVMHPGAPTDLIYEVGSGQAVTPHTLANDILILTGSDSDLNFLPMRKGEPDDSSLVADNSNLEHFGLGLSFAEVQTHDIRRTVQWYKEHPDI